MEKLIAIDFDKTLMDTLNPEVGKKLYSERIGKVFPCKDWWSCPESLDVEIFPEIKPIEPILNILRKESNRNGTHLIILTARIEKLRPQLEKILNKYSIFVDEVIMKRGIETKGDVILNYVKNNPNLKQIDVYDDMQNKQEKLEQYIEIKNQIPDSIQYNIYIVNNGKPYLIESTNKLISIIKEELKNLKPSIYYKK
jgi:hypothetical protein